MTIKPGYIYACTWAYQTVTYYNLITSVTSSKIVGHCVQASDPSQCAVNRIVNWSLATWHNSRNHIIELGKLEDLPELLL